jgi:hypothetical protein
MDALNRYRNILLLNALHAELQVGHSSHKGHSALPVVLFY